MRSCERIGRSITHDYKILLNVTRLCEPAEIYKIYETLQSLQTSETANDAVAMKPPVKAAEMQLYADRVQANEQGVSCLL